MTAANFACLDRGGGVTPTVPVAHNACFLPQGKLQRVEAVPGTRVRCMTGKLWITLAGDADDHILSAGESYVAPNAGLLIAQALCTASYIVEDGPVRHVREHARI